MQLKPITGARLTLDTGEVLTLERLGKGMFHTCYVDRTKGEVYSVTIERESGSDFSKEILSNPQLGCGGTDNPHLPKVEYLDELDKGNRVYRMPLYFPLKAANRGAWAQFKALEAARRRAWNEVMEEQGLRGWGAKPKMRMVDIGYLVNRRTEKLLMLEPSVPEPLQDAIHELTEAAGSYGEGYCLEFSRKNCMIDKAGNLILLDCLFNLEAVEGIRNAQRKRAGIV